MLIIPLESLCETDPLLKQLLSDSEGLKVAEFDADNIPSAPYVCWQIIDAAPVQYLSDRSDMDDIYVQIDVYTSKKSTSRRINDRKSCSKLSRRRTRHRPEDPRKVH